MSVSPELQRRRRVAHAWLAAVLLAGMCLAVIPPERVGWYPVCPVWRYLHVLCPGCGATRAIAALLRGHVTEALRWNALFVALLPFGFAGAAECYRRALRPEAFCWPRIAPVALYGLLAMAGLFAIGRNLFPAAF